MRKIETKDIIRNVKEMCIRANYTLSDDMERAVNAAAEVETSPLGRRVMEQLRENLEIARTDSIPICQDTGITVVFAKVGQEVEIEGGFIGDAIQEGVRRGYIEGFLRKSVVEDPIYRKNTQDNTPAVIHYEIVPGDKLTLIVAPKGAGSENMSRIYMLKPADGIEGVKEAVLKTVREAGPNACPPLVVGVGIGGDFEQCALMAKEALTRNLREKAAETWVERLEDELFEKINRMGIGPAGFGGTVTALAVNIKTGPTHIACLPVAVNLCCHVNRHIRRVL